MNNKSRLRTLYYHYTIIILSTRAVIVMFPSLRASSPRVPRGYGGGGGMRGKALQEGLLVGYNYVPMFSQLAAASSPGLFLARSRRSDSGEGAGKRENTARGGVRRSRENTARGGVRREGEGKGTEGYCSLFQAFR